MKITNLIHLLNDPETLLDQVAENNETLFVQRLDDKSVVIISADEYNKFKQMEYTLKTGQHQKETLQDNGIKSV